MLDVAMESDDSDTSERPDQIPDAAMESDESDDTPSSPWAFDKNSRASAVELWLREDGSRKLTSHQAMDLARRVSRGAPMKDADYKADLEAANLIRERRVAILATGGEDVDLVGLCGGRTQRAARRKHMEVIESAFQHLRGVLSAPAPTRWTPDLSNLLTLFNALAKKVAHTGTVAQPSASAFSSECVVDGAVVTGSGIQSDSRQLYPCGFQQPLFQMLHSPRNSPAYEHFQNHDAPREQWVLNSAPIELVRYRLRDAQGALYIRNRWMEAPFDKCDLSAHVMSADLVDAAIRAHGEGHEYPSGTVGDLAAHCHLHDLNIFHQRDALRAHVGNVTETNESDFWSAMARMCELCGDTFISTVKEEANVQLSISRVLGNADPLPSVDVPIDKEIAEWVVCKYLLMSRDRTEGYIVELIGVDTSQLKAFLENDIEQNTSLSVSTEPMLCATTEEFYTNLEIRCSTLEADWKDSAAPLAALRDTVDEAGFLKECDATAVALRAQVVATVHAIAKGVVSRLDTELDAIKKGELVLDKPWHQLFAFDPFDCEGGRATVFLQQAHLGLGRTAESGNDSIHGVMCQSFGPGEVEVASGSRRTHYHPLGEVESTLHSRMILAFEAGDRVAIVHASMDHPLKSVWTVSETERSSLKKRKEEYRDKVATLSRNKSTSEAVEMVTRNVNRLGAEIMRDEQRISSGTPPVSGWIGIGTFGTIAELRQLLAMSHSDPHTYEVRIAPDLDPDPDPDARVF